jgi:hypothetical protein
MQTYHFFSIAEDVRLSPLRTAPVSGEVLLVYFLAYCVAESTARDAQLMNSVHCRPCPGLPTSFSSLRALLHNATNLGICDTTAKKASC